jgi:hypothetical protein
MKKYKTEDEEMHNFRRECYGEWINAHKTEEDFLFELAEFIYTSEENNAAIHRLIDMFKDKYWQEYLRFECRKNLRFGFVQFMLREHEYEFFNILMIFLIKENDGFQKMLLDRELNKKPVYLIRKEELISREPKK